MTSMLKTLAAKHHSTVSLKFRSYAAAASQAARTALICSGAG